MASGGRRASEVRLAEWVGLDLSAAEAEALAAAYRTMANALARFPEDELKAVEPPLRSLPTPAPGAG